jgi:hypothetical protein
VGSLVFAVTGLTIYVSFEIAGELEDHDPARANLHLDLGLGIAADALGLAAHKEFAKAFPIKPTYEEGCFASLNGTVRTV